MTKKEGGLTSIRLSDEQINALEADLINVPPYGDAPIPVVVRYTPLLIEEVRERRAQEKKGVE